MSLWLATEQRLHLESVEENGLTPFEADGRLDTYFNLYNIDFDKTKEMEKYCARLLELVANYSGTPLDCRQLGKKVIRQIKQSFGVDINPTVTFYVDPSDKNADKPIQAILRLDDSSTIPDGSSAECKGCGNDISLQFPATSSPSYGT